MKTITFVLLLSLTLLTVPAMATATLVFNNFPISGQIQGWPINITTASASDSFIVPEDPLINTVHFGALLASGDTVTSVDWVIGTVVGGTLGPVLASGTGIDTRSGLVTNVNGFDVDEVSFFIPTFDIDDGTLYYLTLENAVSANGGLVTWDQNDGPNSTLAWYDAGAGPVPISDGAGGCATSSFSGGTGGGTCSESFQLLYGPEPSTFALLGSGALVAFLLRRRAVRR